MSSKGDINRRGKLSLSLEEILRFRSKLGSVLFLKYTLGEEES